MTTQTSVALALISCLFFVRSSRTAHAQTSPPPSKSDTSVVASAGADATPNANAPFSVDTLTTPTPGAVPPPAKMTYLQYGIAFTAEFATGGVFCGDPQLDCILGSGGGIAGRFGWRSAGDWYLGGAYELSKQDPTKLYRLAILQQLRAEARHYWYRGKDTQPLVAMGAGLAGYGNEWSIATFGPTAFVGVGVESQLADGPVLGFLLGYRPIYLQKFSDTNNTSHGPGFAHMIAIDITLEARDPITQ